MIKPPSTEHRGSSRRGISIRARVGSIATRQSLSASNHAVSLAPGQGRPAGVPQGRRWGGPAMSGACPATNEEEEIAFMPHVQAAKRVASFTSKPLEL
jgi:hypothetical protein